MTQQALEIARTNIGIRDENEAITVDTLNEPSLIEEHNESTSIESEGENGKEDKQKAKVKASRARRASSISRDPTTLMGIAGFATSEVTNDVTAESLKRQRRKKKRRERRSKRQRRKEKQRKCQYLL